MVSQYVLLLLILPHFMSFIFFFSTCMVLSFSLFPERGPTFDLTVFEPRLEVTKAYVIPKPHHKHSNCLLPHVLESDKTFFQSMVNTSTLLAWTPYFLSKWIISSLCSIGTITLLFPILKPLIFSMSPRYFCPPLLNP